MVSFSVPTVRLPTKVVPAVPGGRFRASGCSGGPAESSSVVVPWKFQKRRSSSMRVSGTSSSLLQKGGSSTVCGFVKARNRSWHSWNYFRRYGYHARDTDQNLLPGALCHRSSAEELITPTNIVGYDHAHRVLHISTRVEAATSRGSGAPGGAIGVANEANDVANDVAGDVATDDGPHPPALRPFPSRGRGLASVPTFIHSAGPPQSTHNPAFTPRGRANV